MATDGPTETAYDAGTVPALRFAVEDVTAVPDAVAPTLRFDLRIDAGAVSIRSVMLETQIRIAATQRRYTADEQARLAELFGTPERWGDTVRSLLWTHTTHVVPPFEGTVAAALHVPCTYDFEVASTSYLAGLSTGEIPLELLFSGTVLHTGPGGDDVGRLQVSRISWNAEAEYRLPVAVWREAIDRHFPNSAWLRLDRRVLDRLTAFKAQRVLAGYEEALDVLLATADPAPAPAPGTEPDPDPGGAA